VKAALGEEVTAEELGGADLHCRFSIISLCLFTFCTNYDSECSKSNVNFAYSFLLPKYFQNTRYITWCSYIRFITILISLHSETLWCFENLLRDEISNFNRIKLIYLMRKVQIIVCVFWRIL